MRISDWSSDVCSSDLALLEVIDRGRGMTAEFIRRELFKPFSSSKAGGFGIGAFEARALAQAMGGRIDVESRPGAGSRFTLRLPLALGDFRGRSEEHTSELQSLMRISYAVFCLKKKRNKTTTT